MAPFLAADVGGTHARLAVARPTAEGAAPEILTYRKYACGDWPSLVAIMRHFVDGNPEVVLDRCALACAGFAVDGDIINVNLPWKVSLSDLRRELNLQALTLVNDFAALACAMQFLEPASATPLSRAIDSTERGPRVVVGPGTGLGTAVLFPGHPNQSRQIPWVLATEAGQTSLAPGNALERDVLAVLAKEGGYVSIEDVVSGPGLLRLYRALGDIRKQAAVLDAPELITQAASERQDALAVQALDTFCALLGSFTGDLALLYGAGGGIWLAGGILPQIKDFLMQSRFQERFLAKGRMRAFLERVPVYMIEHGKLGVIGAAQCHVTAMQADGVDTTDTVTPPG